MRLPAARHSSVIEAPLDCLTDAVIATQKAMADASAAVLDGFRLRSEVEIFRYPNRFSDERGGEMWNLIQEILREIDD